jgi:hypothetical protein
MTTNNGIPPGVAGVVLMRAACESDVHEKHPMCDVTLCVPCGVRLPPDFDGRAFGRRECSRCLGMGCGACNGTGRV